LILYFTLLGLMLNALAIALKEAPPSAISSKDANCSFVSFGLPPPPLHDRPFAAMSAMFSA
jgi:hypothetical protein